MPNTTLTDYGWWTYYGTYDAAHLAANSKALVALGAVDTSGYWDKNDRAEKFENGVWTEIERIGIYKGFTD